MCLCLIFLFNRHAFSDRPFHRYSIHQSDALWDYFYYDTSSFIPWNKNSPITSSRSYHVFDVTFSQLGQCIYVRGDWQSNLLVSSTNFYSLNGNNMGAAIYQDAGSCIQYHVCNANSRTDLTGAHSYINLNKLGLDYRNYFIESSIYSTTSGYQTFHQYANDNRINQVNVSNCAAEVTPIAVVVGGMISLCTFYLNTGDHKLLDLSEKSSFSSISLCNFVSNIEQSFVNDNNGLIYTRNANGKISRSIFKNNDVKYIFFAFENGALDISNCYFDNPHGTLSNGNNIVFELDTQAFDLRLGHLSTGLCEAAHAIPSEEKCKTNQLNLPYHSMKIKGYDMLFLFFSINN